MRTHYKLVFTSNTNIAMQFVPAFSVGEEAEINFYLNLTFMS